MKLSYNFFKTITDVTIDLFYKTWYNYTMKNQSSINCGMENNMAENNVNEIIDIIKGKIQEKKAEGVSTDGLPEKFAAEFQLKDGGVFYVELKNGEINIAPYEYNDRDILIKTTAETLKKILNKDMRIQKALITGKIKISGDIQKAMLLKKVL